MLSAVMLASRRSARRMRSAPLATLRWAVPVEHPRGLVVARLEEIGADRLCECGVINEERDILAGLFAGALPARADLRAIAVAHVDAVVRRILGIGGFGRNEGEVSVEEQRLDAPGETGLVSGELTNLRHGKPPLLAG